jgi:hypothetical protein
VAADPRNNLKAPGILFLLALVIAIVANGCASYLPYDVRDQLIIWAALFFFVATVPMCFIPAKHVAAVWALASGGWILALRFTGDIGADTHMSGGLLIGSLLLFTPVMAIKTHESTRELKILDSESTDGGPDLSTSTPQVFSSDRDVLQ